jgi:DNA-binding response OmpR family regulator
VKEGEKRSTVAKVLIVVDEPNIREVVGLYLRRDGYEVVTTSDGEEDPGSLLRQAQGRDGPGCPQ